MEKNHFLFHRACLFRIKQKSLLTHQSYRWIRLFFSFFFIINTKKHTTRGFHAHFILIDEISFVDPEVITKVLFPLMVTGAVIIAITTLDDKSTYINNLISMTKSSPEPIINLIQLSLICETCRNRGVTSQCIHKINTAPRWHDTSKMKNMEILMSADTGAFTRETLGMETLPDAIKVFDKEKVEDLRRFSRSSLREIDYRRVYVSLDPAAGGKTSDFTICSTVLFKKIVVVSFFLFSFFFFPF